MNITRRVLLLNLGLGACAAVLLLISFFWIIFEERLERSLLSNTQSLQFDLLETQSSLERVHRTLELVVNSGLASQFLIREPEVRQSAMHKLLLGVLPSNKDYVQARVLDANGIELLRMEQTDDGLILRPDEELQDKSGRDYIQKAKRAPIGTFLYSDITLNEEFGRIEQPEWSALRGVAVIGDSLGNRLGYFVINVRMDDVLERLALSPFADDAIVFDDSGRYLFHSDRTKTFGAQRGQDASFNSDNPELFQRIIAARTEDGFDAYIIEKTKLFGEFTIPGDANGRSIFVLRELNTNALAREAFVSLANISWVALVVLGAILAVGMVTARYLKGRFEILMSMVSYFRAGNHAKGESLVRQASQRNDELFQVGRAFAELVEDISKTSQELELANDKIQRVFDSISSAIIVADSKGKIITCNQATQRIFGFKESELIGANLKCLMPETIARDHDGFMANAKLGQSSRTLGALRELIAVRKNGEHFPIELGLNQIQSGTESLFVGIVTDLSAIKKTRDDLVRYAEQLRLSNEYLQRYAYALSHDLKAPVRKITLFSQMIDRSKLDEDDAHHLERIESAGVRASNMIDALMSLAQVESTASSVSECELETIARTAVMQAAEQHPDVKLDVVYEALPRVVCDEVLVGSIFQNLVENSIKYAKRNGHITLRFRCVESWPEAAQGATESESAFCILVEDDGPGIDQSEQQAVFDIFYRAKHEHDKVEGSGVGLSTCRKIMDAHGGQILIDPTYTEGARFILIFPKKP